MGVNFKDGDDTKAKGKNTKFSLWVIIFVCCALVVISIWVIVLHLPPIFSITTDQGGFDIDQVTLSSNMQGNQPTEIKDVFKPSDTIFCTVKTTGTDGGVVGMRWFYGNKKIYETTIKAQNYVVYSAIRSNSSIVLAEGKYHVDIVIVDEVIKTVDFEVKIYHPSVEPPVPTPIGHRSVETPWFPEVPFAFDEIWTIGNKEWKVNEVKVVLKDDTQQQFVAVLVDSDIKGILSLTDSEAQELTRPVALYALENGYIEKAETFKIDGRHYDLLQSLFVILSNPSTHEIFRVEFKINELRPGSKSN